jgi:hypothetical protein
MTFCAFLFTLLGKGCDLYCSIVEILQILSHPFCMQNKQAYTPEVCCCITWAIIIDTCSFFDNIKLAEDFLEKGSSYNSQSPHWMGTTWPSNMASRSNVITSPKSGPCQNFLSGQRGAIIQGRVAGVAINLCNPNQILNLSAGSSTGQ